MLLSRKFIAIVITLLIGIHIIPYMGEIDGQSIYLLECPISENGYISDRQKPSYSAFELSLRFIAKERNEIVQVSSEDNLFFNGIESLLIYNIDTTDIMIPAVAKPFECELNFILSSISLQSVEDHVDVYALPSFNRFKNQ